MNDAAAADIDAALRNLYRSLKQRWRPEDVARQVGQLLDLSSDERSLLDRAAKSQRDWFYSSMSSDFARPVGMQRSLAVAVELFGRDVQFAEDDVEAIEAWLTDVELSIGKTFGRSDFKYDRIPAPVRRTAGITLSRRQYNKRFRLVARMEAKARKLAKEQLKRSFALASKNRLAAQITWEDFSSDRDTAALVAYYVSKCNRRSVFTNTSQERPYDEICEMLMQRCRRKADRANWWAIAHVLPEAEVLAHLADDQKGVLMAAYFELMHGAAGLLEELWNANTFRDDMVVVRGNDSTTWNLTAGAWNKLREGWFQLVYDLGLTSVVEGFCPGKVLRLMAADVAAWHRASGGGLHPDTSVWKVLPRPWEVMSGVVDCPKSRVDATCERHGLDPEKSGWSAPRPKAAIAPFTPTPELVHGVAVGSPILAGILRRAGVFSGKVLKGEVLGSAVAEIRARHCREQEARRRAAEAAKPSK